MIAGREEGGFGWLDDGTGISSHTRAFGWLAVLARRAGEAWAEAEFGRSLRKLATLLGMVCVCRGSLSCRRRVLRG